MDNYLLTIDESYHHQGVSQVLILYKLFALRKLICFKYLTEMEQLNTFNCLSQNNASFKLTYLNKMTNKNTKYPFCMQMYNWYQLIKILTSNSLKWKKQLQGYTNNSQRLTNIGYWLLNLAIFPIKNSINLHLVKYS